ncbi:uncharacterized protein LOC134542628 [Bacillus rossius redtenbacheri]|uniref:uncharacterized protein LOC134542628 n=1 Tax=Bacillus rossius redtenbacheri TaxID=93214 RepID=UPI002FDEBEA1
MPGKCHFQEMWLEEEGWRTWLRKGKDKFFGFCSLCKKQIDVSHSGVNAIKSHEKGKKHSEFSSCLKSGKQKTLSSFRAIPMDTDGPSMSVPQANTPSPSLPEPKPSTSASSQEHTAEPSRLSTFLVNDSVTKAEIVWATHCVFTHASSRSGELAVKLFPIMFPDSSLASKMKMHKDKIAYSITYGLGPHFAKCVSHSVQKSPFYALSIDESLNDVCQKGQMDIVVKYWDAENSCVCTKYLTSAFLEHSKAADLLNNLIVCIGEADLSLGGLVQIATDGPNVNLKLISDLKSYMRCTLDSEKEILDLGTCSLHIVNGAYKTAHAKVGWQLNEFLRALYSLFKNYPSRRAVYQQITGSRMFPKKFCAIRWTENSSVMKRCSEIIPHLKKYVTDKEIEKNPPNSQNFHVVKKALLEDPVLEAKLHFSAMISEELEEFLTCFQRNDPLLPFLYQEVFQLMKNIASRVFTKSAMEKVVSASQLKHLNVKNETDLRMPDSIEIGFGATFCLKKVKELHSLRFKADCKQFLLQLFSKLEEKSPLRKRIVLGSTCLSPSVIVKDVRTSRAKIAIEELISLNHLSPADGDVVLREYAKFCALPDVLKATKFFNWKKYSLDKFLFQLLSSAMENAHNLFVSFIQRFLICFHGNAAVERSFSFNKEFLVENLQEKSLVAQRLVHDHVSSLPGGIETFSHTISKQMILNFRNAASKRRDDLMKKKIKEDESVNARKRAAHEITLLELKKKKVLEEKKEELLEIDRDLKKLRNKICL